MYPGGRAEPLARRLSLLWSVVLSAGLLPRRWVALEVVGRRSGEIRTFPLGMADMGREWYLVSMLGEHCNWVRNVRAADGRAVIHRRRRVPCRLIEVPIEERAPIIKRYLSKVPGARPHIPVDRHAPLAEVRAIAPRYPVFHVVLDSSMPDPRSSFRGRPERGWKRPGPSRRRRRWRRIAGATLLLLAVVVVVAVELFVALQSVPPPLKLPPGTMVPPAGPLTGDWQPEAGSRAGFRIPETVLLASNDVVGRTTQLTGTAQLTSTQITHITIRVDLRTITINGKHQPALATSLDTARYPTATFALTQPIELSPSFADGRKASLTAGGQLALHGTTEPVSVALTARRSGNVIDLAGSTRVLLARWHVARPAGFGPLGSLADHATAEFLIVLHRTNTSS
jgi:deazaflavin-dependent oxidoreductase (nitroreductase family)